MDIFEGKTAIITGGASGIGRALGEQLAERGALVTLADVNAALLEETAGSLAAKGCNVKGIPIDVTDFEAVKRLVGDTVSVHARLDYMFNNAGIAIGGETHKFSYDDWHRVIDINLYGVVHGVAAAYPQMVKQGSGHIVNTSSLAGLVPAPGQISYTTSKYGVVGLSNALRTEGAYYGIKVSVVCPGFIRTPIFQDIKFIGVDRDKVLKMVPKGMPPEQCAGIILRGVERNKAIITVTPMVKALWIMQRISPVLVRPLFMGMAKLMRKAKSG